MWEEVPDTFGENCFLSFSNFEKLFFLYLESCKNDRGESWNKLWENHFFRIQEKLKGFFRPREWTESRIGSLVRRRHFGKVTKSRIGSPVRRIHFGKSDFLVYFD